MDQAPETWVLVSGSSVKLNELEKKNFFIFFPKFFAIFDDISKSASAEGNEELF